MDSYMDQLDHYVSSVIWEFLSLSDLLHLRQTNQYLSTHVTQYILRQHFCNVTVTCDDFEQNNTKWQWIQKHISYLGIKCSHKNAMICTNDELPLCHVTSEFLEQLHDAHSLTLASCDLQLLPTGKWVHLKLLSCNALTGLIDGAANLSHPYPKLTELII